MQEQPPCMEHNLFEVEGNNLPNMEEIQHQIAPAPIRTSYMSGFNNASTGESLSD
jgi:hypothetical protein